MIDSLALLEGLLKQYSPTGSEAGAVNYLVSAMSELGFAAHVDAAGNAVGTLGNGPNHILLLGHIDTVPGDLPIYISENRLHGRGSVDAKGPLACFTAAAAQTGVQPGWKITVIGAVGEEGNSPGAIFVRDTLPKPDMVVIGEPSGWEHVTLGYKGSTGLKYYLSKPLTHSASGAEGVCDEALGFYQRLKEIALDFNQEKQRVFDQLTVSLRHMHSDNNGINTTAEMHINIRLPLDIQKETLHGMLPPLTAHGSLEFGAFFPLIVAKKIPPWCVHFLPQSARLKGNPVFC